MRRLLDIETDEAIDEARRCIAALLDARAEWFCTETPVTRRAPARARTHPTVSANDATFALHRGECQLVAARGRLLLCLPTARGMRTWRVAAWEQSGERLLFQTTRRMGGGRATLELIPRAPACDTRALVTAARHAACERLAAIACRTFAGAKILRAGVSRGARRGEAGRYARIVLQTRRERIALAAPLVELGAHDVDAFLTSALLWFARLGDAARDSRALTLRLVVSPHISRATAARLALLRAEVRRAVSLCELDVSLLPPEASPTDGASLADGDSATDGGSAADGEAMLVPLDAPALDALLSAASASRLYRAPERASSRAAREIVALAPGAIDVVRARHGETLRFHGLAFARIRRVFEREHVWFGVEGARSRRLLDEENRQEFSRLVAELNAHRRAGSDSPRHALYRAAPEAWLESMLRRDISQLDPGLRVAPLHAQFRTAREHHAGAARPVDLLALRRDGRLVVVELKISKDAALPLQGADYWRRVESERLRGRLRTARLFDDAEIADAPPLLYLVAPLLSFHRSLEHLTRQLDPRIQIYRFDINEDWRTGVRVARRTRIN